MYNTCTINKGAIHCYFGATNFYVNSVVTLSFDYSIILSFDLSGCSLSSYANWLDHKYFTAFSRSPMLYGTSIDYTRCGEE